MADQDCEALTPHPELVTFVEATAPYPPIPGPAVGRPRSEARQLWPHETRVKPLTPRIKLAARLYASGICKTKGEAAENAGLTKSTFYVTSNADPQVAAIMAQVDAELANETIQTGELIKQLGRKALLKIEQVMDNTLVKPEVQLKAAQDLADRSPETSKVINVNAQIASPLSEDQLAELRRAMLMASNLKEKFPAAAAGSFVTVSDAGTARSLDLVKERAPLALPAGGENAG